jgi:type VII secretion integral membrane protein EccD
LVSVTVASPTRRVDLVLPEAVPVVELVHELARSVGLLDPATVHGGYRLVTVGGRELSGNVGLAGQGIQDGALLTVTAGVNDELPRLYDDVVEAMVDVVERDFPPWDPKVGRRVALTTAVLLAAMGALSLVMVVDGGIFAAATASVVALGLITGALVVSRIRRDARSAVGLTWMGATYAAIASFGLAPHGTVFALPVAYAGAGAATAGLTCLLGLGEHRCLVIPPVVVGAIFLATGSVTRVLPVDPALTLSTALTIVVMTGSFVPTLALGATGTMADQLSSTVETPVDIDQVSADAQVAHQIVMAASLTAGLLLVLVAPFAVSLGLAGTLLAVTCSLIVMLRTRRHRAGSQVQIGLVSGITGVLSVAIAALCLHPGWRPAVAVCLATAGIALFAATLVPSPQSVRRARLGDLVESAALLATLPLLLAAVGVFAAIRS